MKKVLHDSPILAKHKTRCGIPGKWAKSVGGITCDSCLALRKQGLEDGTCLECGSFRWEEHLPKCKQGDSMGMNLLHTDTKPRPRRQPEAT